MLGFKETGLSNNTLNIYWGETSFFQRNTLYFHSYQEISKCYSFAIIGTPVLRGWSTYSSGEAYGWCNCRQLLDMSILLKLLDMSILVKLHDMSILVRLQDMNILLQKLGC